MSILALIPARAGSKGIPNKSFTPLWGLSPLQRAIDCARKARLTVWVTTDAHPGVSLSADGQIVEDYTEPYAPMYPGVNYLRRPPELAQDDTPMIAVVQHALAQIPGEPDDIIVLLQPTQPLRTPAHVQAAIELLQTSGADSVVSVVELPRTHHPELVCAIVADGLCPWYWWEWADLPSSRHDVDAVFLRDGTVYAFWRKTVTERGSIYGDWVKPLIIPPDETCPLDTEADWIAAERRFQERARVRQL